MSLTDILKFSLKLIIAVYLCGILVFILLNVGSANENYLAEAFSPVKLFEEILSGNLPFILFTTLGAVFIFRFNHLRSIYVDYWMGRGRPWIEGTNIFRYVTTAYGAVLGAAIGAVLGAIFDNIEISDGISLGIIVGVTIGLLFWKQIMRLFGDLDEFDSDEEDY